MNITPLNDLILIRREPPRDRTDGGLYIPDNAKEKLNIGTVLAVGRGRPLENGKVKEPELRKGDRVVFGKYVGNEFEHDGEKNLVLMREGDVFGVLSE